MMSKVLMEGYCQRAFWSETRRFDFVARVGAGNRLVHGNLFIVIIIVVSTWVCGVLYHLQCMCMQSIRACQRSVTPAIMRATPAQSSSHPTINPHSCICSVSRQVNRVVLGQLAELLESLLLLS